MLKAGSKFGFTCSRIRGRPGQRSWPVPPFGNYNEDYHLLQAAKAEPLHRLLRNQTAADVPIEFSKGEAANGQHEVNIVDHVLESADRAWSSSTAPESYLNGQA